MSARDKCEPAVIRALAKQGWIVVKKQYAIPFSQAMRRLFADLLLQQQVDEHSYTMLVVEVKCFSTPDDELDDLYRALGQYQIYRTAMSLRGDDIPLYLAIPKAIYDTLFTEDAVRLSVQLFDIKMVVVVLEAEEVVKWQI